MNVERLPTGLRTLLLVYAAASAQVGLASSGCSGDLDGNRTVDFSDVSLALLNYGPCVGCQSDLDQTAQVDAEDIALLLLEFGPCPIWYTVLEQYPNPAVVSSLSLRNAITSTGLPWRVRDTKTGIEMVLIPPGTYQRGGSASSGYPGNSNEFPVHSVTLTRAFYLGRYEVTQAQWSAKMGVNPSNHVASKGFPGSTARPVEWVSWSDIQSYCAATDMRLPTEAEWEFAYRAGTTTAYHGWVSRTSGTSDESQLGNIGWFYYNSDINFLGQTHDVGIKACNGFGLFDMSGNVWEVMEDGEAEYTSGVKINPIGPDHGMLRGGSYDSPQLYCRSSHRGGNMAQKAVDVGFRVARNP